MRPFQLIVAAGFVLAATSAYGDSRITLTPSEGRGGVSVLASGTFSSKEEDVTVRVGGTKVQVFELAADRLRFLIPLDAKKGPLEVEFEVRGARTRRAIYTVNDKRETGSDGPAAPPGPPVFGDARLELARRKATVTATTALPDGFSVIVTVCSMSVEGRAKETVLATTKVRARGGKLRADLGLAEGDLLGRYVATLGFELARQSAFDQKRWTGEPVAWTHAYATIGTDAELADHSAIVAGHYAEIASRTRALRDAIVKGTADAGKTRFVRGAFLDAEAWVRFVEEEIYGPLRVLRAEEIAFSTRWLGPRDERANVEALERIKEVVRFARDSSTHLLEKNKLVVPETLREPRGLDR